MLVELEPGPDGDGSGLGYRSARRAMARLGVTTTRSELTGLLAHEVRELTGYERVLVLCLDDQGNAEVVGEDREPERSPRLGMHFPASSFPDSERALYEHTPLRLIADVAASPVGLVPEAGPDAGVPVDLSRVALCAAAPSYLEQLAAADVTASLGIPLMVDDRLWGLVVCLHHGGPRRPTQDTRAAAELVTQMASHLVAHRERADARDAAVATLAEIAALASRLSAGESAGEGDLLDALFADPALLTAFGATGAAQLYGGRLRTAGAVPAPEVLERIADLLNEPDAYVSHSARIADLDPELAAISDLAAGVLRVGTTGERWGLWFRPERGQPLTWGGDPAAHPCAQQSPPWLPWHVEAAEELGRHLNSLLLLRSREQVAMAESMQRSVVLDRAPRFAGVELVARYRPATTYQLGGDWWDAFDLDEHRLVVVVGDVAGHGVAAASAMTQVRTALRAYLFEGHGPAESLDRLDLLMDGLLDVGVATAVIALLDRRAGTVELASAGHPDPLLVPADGPATELELDHRPLLGVGMGEATSLRIDLAPGTDLVLFTDGLVERRGTDLDAQVAGLVDLAGSRGSDESVEDWADRILVALDTADDDTTLLSLRWAGTGSA